MVHDNQPSDSSVGRVLSVMSIGYSKVQEISLLTGLSRVVTLSVLCRLKDKGRVVNAERGVWHLRDE